MSTTRLVIGLSVTLATIILGVLVLLGYMLEPDTSTQFRWIMGGVLIAFGVFRGAMLYVERKRKANSTADESQVS